MTKRNLFAQITRAMNKSVVWTALSAGALLCAASLVPKAVSPQSRNSVAQAAKSIISLVNETPIQARATTPVKGEASFANAPANFHAFASARVGENATPERLTLRFSAATTLTEIKSTEDFVVEPGSTCITLGTYAAGETCTLLVRFTPQGAGRRLGTLTIANTASAQPLGIGLGGNGYAPVVSFTPAVISTVPGTVSSGTGIIKSSTNLTSAGDILYIADTGNDLVRKIDSSGTITNVTPVAAPASVAVDNFGLIYLLGVSGSTDYFSYYEPNGGYTFYFTSYTPGTCTPSSPCNLGTVGMGEPAEINIDANNNLFLEEETKGAMEAPVAGLVGEGLLPPIDAWYLNDAFAYTSAPASTFAVDPSDNLYTDYTYGSTTCYVVQEPLYGAEGSNPNYARVAGGTKCGYSGDGGQATDAEIGTSIGQMTFDIAGDLYFSDTANQRVRMIDAATGIINTIAGTGTAGYAGDGGAGTSATLSSPTGVAVDSQGQVYIISGTGTTSGGAQVVRKLGPNGILSFGSQVKGTASAAHVVTVSNIGNSSLTLTNALFTGANASAFSIDPTTTSCMLTAGATLFAGQSCKVGILFKPTAGGSFSANFVMLDNTVTNSNTVQLSGTGTLPAPTFKITSPANGASFTSGTTVTFSASVTGSPQPTGTVQFKVDSVNHGSPVTLSSTGTASVSLTGLSTASHTLAVTYSGDANWAAAGPISVSITVTAAAVTKLASMANPASQCKPASFSITVSGAGLVTPTGNVTLKKGSTVLASGTLSGGKASVSTSALAVGKNVLNASYGGDLRYGPATSAAFTQTIVAGCTQAVGFGNSASIK